MSRAEQLVYEQTDDMKRSRRVQLMDGLNKRPINYKTDREARERSQALKSMVEFNKQQVNHKKRRGVNERAREKMFHEHKMEAVSPISIH